MATAILIAIFGSLLAGMLTRSRPVDPWPPRRVLEVSETLPF